MRYLPVLVLALACSSPELNPQVEPETEPTPVAAPTPPPVDDELLTGEDENAEPTAPRIAGDGSAPGIKVEAGESLGLYADWAGISAERIAERNQITVRSKLKIGQELIIPVQGVAADTFRQLRSDFIAGRMKRFLDKRGGLVRVTEHTVRKGESLWRIARTNGRLPLWVIQHYNPGVNLDRLAIGDTVKIPITAAQVRASR